MHPRFFLSLRLLGAALTSLLLAGSALAADSPLRVGQPLILGANNNESPDRLQPALLEQTQTKWIRAFFPASPFLEGKTSFATDEQILATKKLCDLGYHLFLTIKWDNRKDYANDTPRRVPPPDSAEEKRWFAFASQLVRAFPGQVSGLELVNELTVDTDPADLKPGSDGVAPMIRFLQRLASFLTAEKHLAREGCPLPLYAGGFTRMDQPAMQKNPVLISFMRWLGESPHIFGVNFHLHQLDLEQFGEALDFVRSHIGKKPIAISEYSLVWRYKAHLGEKLSAGKTGAAFCQAYRRSPGQTVVDYLSAAARQPVTETEWHAFLASRSWFDPDFLTQSKTLMEKYGVTLATYGFSNDPERKRPRRTLTMEWTPWELNQVFVFSFVQQGADGAAPRNFGFYDDWLRIQRAAESKTSN